MVSAQTRKIRLPWSTAVVGICASLASVAFVTPAFAGVDVSAGDSDWKVMDASGVKAEVLQYYADRDEKLMQKAIQDNDALDLDSRGAVESRVYSPKSGEPGEIWVSTFGNSSGSSAIVGHAAIVSNRKSITIESFGENYSPIGKDGVQRYHNYWQNKPGGKILLGNKVSSLKKRKAAASWAESQVGKPYNWNFLNKWDTGRYYCSQLVWRAWLNQGNNIDYITADTIVTPAELVNSPATVTLWATNG